MIVLILVVKEYTMIIYRAIGLMSKVFTNGPGDRGSLPGRVISKTQKWYLMPPCLTFSIITQGLRVKWSNPENGVVPLPIPWCSSYWKGSLPVTLDYGHKHYFFMISSLCNGKLKVHDRHVILWKFRNLRKTVKRNCSDC